MPVPVRRARPAYVRDAEDEELLHQSILVGDAEPDDSTLVLDEAEAEMTQAAIDDNDAPSPSAARKRRLDSTPRRTPPKRVRMQDDDEMLVWSLPLHAARPREVRVKQEPGTESEALPPLERAPVLSDAEPSVLLPPTRTPETGMLPPPPPAVVAAPPASPPDALADLSASLSASSHSRALMLARPRPTACIEVSSLDPHAAARAAAILRVHHHYIQEGYLAQEPVKRAGDALYPPLPDTSASASLPALLHAAEAAQAAERRAATPAPPTPWLPGAFTPRSERRARVPVVTAYALRPQAQSGKWSEHAWAQLDRQFRAQVQQLVDASPESDSVAARRAAALNVDPAEVLIQFLEAEGLEPDDLQGEWQLTLLYARVPALQARYLRHLDKQSSEEDASAALLEKSFHALSDVRAPLEAFVRGVHSTPKDEIRPRRDELSGLSLATDDDALYEHPPDTSYEHEEPANTSVVSRLWSKVWGERKTPSKEAPSPVPTPADTTEERAANTSVRAPSAAPMGRNGTSSVQSTAFSALGAEAQQQAAAQARRLAQMRARAWQSPRRARMQARDGHPDVSQRGASAREAYIASRDYWQLRADTS